MNKHEREVNKENLSKNIDLPLEDEPSKTIEEIASIQKGRRLEDLSIKELATLKEKYIKLKQELNIGGKETKEG